MTASLAVGAIEFYQRHLSPLKGFRCAHRALHGRSSCSQFAKRVVQRVGLAALPELLKRRFDKCACAARAIRNGAKRAVTALRHPGAISSTMLAATTTSGVLDYESPQTREQQRQQQEPKRESCYNTSDCIPDLGECGCQMMAEALPDAACACDFTP